jgi:tetratricopeptide (TPR) repeat protein
MNRICQSSVFSGVDVSADAEIKLCELDLLAPEVIGTGRPARYAALAGELADSDFRGHPWARLLLGCSLGDVCDPRGSAHTVAALRAFRRSGDSRGVAYACFVLGCRALERGDIARAAQWWQKARAASSGGAAGFEVMLAHMGLQAYAQGELRTALTVTEEAVALARLRGALRGEATALMNLGFFRLWVGDFSQALDALNCSEKAFGEIQEEFDRYELPLCLAARGVLWALRGDFEQAVRDFDGAIESARGLSAGWYEAIAYALRAEFTAPVDPRRAADHARIAAAELGRRGDQWWGSWAAGAVGVAAAVVGDHDAAVAVLRRVLRDSGPVLEQARIRLLLGEILLGSGRGVEALPLLREAAQVFRTAGARYWAVRSYVALASLDPAKYRIPRSLAGNADDPAYRRLLCAGELRLVAFGPGRILRDGRPVIFCTASAARAIFLLALAGPDGMHVEELADKLWPTASADRRHMLGRVRTLLWDMRRGLGPHAWRIERRNAVIRMDLAGAAFDLAETRATTRRVLGGGRPRRATATLSGQLRKPLLFQWAYESWVIDECLQNELLADQLAYERSS